MNVEEMKTTTQSMSNVLLLTPLVESITVLLEPIFLVPFGFFTKQKKGIGKSHFKVTGRPDKTCILTKKSYSSVSKLSCKSIYQPYLDKKLHV